MLPVFRGLSEPGTFLALKRLGFLGFLRQASQNNEKVGTFDT